MSWDPVGPSSRFSNNRLRKNQPLTITHPEIKRFFITAQEAISLVLQAFAIGDHGDILVLDMGEPISILQLARTLINLSGKTEDQVSIWFTGLREGEKLYEELFFSTEKGIRRADRRLSESGEGHALGYSRPSSV